MLLAIEAGERFSFCLCVPYTFSPISTISIQIVERENCPVNLVLWRSPQQCLLLLSG